VVYILFETGLRISELCDLMIKDMDLDNRIVDIDLELEGLYDMTLVIVPTKTSAVTMKLPIYRGCCKMLPGHS